MEKDIRELLGEMTVEEKIARLCGFFLRKSGVGFPFVREAIGAIVTLQPDILLAVGGAVIHILFDGRFRMIELANSVPIATGLRIETGRHSLFLVRGESMITARPDIEAKHTALDQAQQVAVVVEHHVLNAVRGHVDAVAHLRLETVELIAVIAVQTVPGSKPHHALAVLNDLGDIPLRHATELVEVGHHTLRLGTKTYCAA